MSLDTSSWPSTAVIHRNLTLQGIKAGKAAALRTSIVMKLLLSSLGTIGPKLHTLLK